MDTLPVSRTVRGRDMAQAVRLLASGLFSAQHPQPQRRYGGSDKATAGRTDELMLRPADMRGTGTPRFDSGAAHQPVRENSLTVHFFQHIL